jgi:tetrahydromethanopterin S-methyltransferase subunit B
VTITSIDGVLAALDETIARALADGSRLGYFAAIYRNVTAKVREGIQTGFFDDGPRMERLDVVFASRYLDALAAFESGGSGAGTPGSVTASWRTAFDAAATARPIILQHLLVGINAHINLDLGIAAATVAPGEQLASLRRDFDRINEILASLMAGIEDEISSLSPWIKLLRRIGGRDGDELVRFSIEIARTQAWAFATELAPLDQAHWSGPIGARDTVVARLGRAVLHPGLLSVGLAVIGARESKDVRGNIEVLRGVQPPPLAVVEARVEQSSSTTETT